MGGVEGAAALCAAASAAAQAVGSETARKLSAAFMVDALADGFLEDILPAHWVAAMARAPAEAVSRHRRDKGRREEGEGEREGG